MITQLKKQLRLHVSSQKGFSLLEILVATVIASMIILMITISYNSILKSIKSVSGYAKFYENVNLAIYRIDKDITNIYYNKERKKISFICEIEGGNSVLNFVTTLYKDFNFLGDIKRPYRSSDIIEVGYYLIDDIDKPERSILIRREEKHYDDDPVAGGEANILLKNVVQLLFEFKQGNDWTDKWDSRRNKRIPKTIRTTLTVKNQNDKEEKFIFTSNISMM